jgi:phosphoribosyl 1,2-cyclic phosphodiesterase
MIRTRFWGVRGSVPSPGPETAGIGGNTSCVEVRCGDELLVFDGGTGLRLLGKSLLPQMPLTVHLFFSHVHWDHIQGFPFFAPAFAPGNAIHMYGSANYFGTVETAMAGQMEFPNFPVKLNELGSRLVFHDLREGQTVDVADGVRVHTAAGNHPGGVLAYRVEHGGKSVVYATDTEHLPTGIDERLARLASGADLFIYDSMYTPEEYEGKADGRPRIGWGHSTYVAGTELARAAGVKQLVLFHHDPDQSDEAVRDKERRSRALFPESVAAYEGLVLEV